ncbi:MAG TPA: WXG100 family type VII secretion target [Ruminococcus sp.]|nr:WXG100 family type VII secretion target [Ruminococcus sp.]
MGNIRMDIESILNFKQAIGEKIQEFDEAISRTNALNNNIAASWSGQAKEAYMNVSQNMMINQQSMREILNRFYEFANTAAVSFDTIDAECAQMINNSF